MKYRIKLIPKAVKDLDDITGRNFSSVKEKILSLADNPRPFASKKLTLEDGYRIRCGDFRVLYRIDDTLKEVIVYRIKYRREAYR